MSDVSPLKFQKLHFNSRNWMKKSNHYWN